MNMVIYNREGGYTGYLGNVLFQTASTIGIAEKNNMEYCFPPKDYYNAFVGEIPQKKLADVQAIDYNEPNYHYDEVSFYPMPDGAHRNLIGYYQSEKYWKHCEEKIRKIFTFKDQVRNYISYKYLNNIQPSKTLISIHVRRGDYLSHPDHHPVLPLSYYEKAIDIIKDAIGLPMESLQYVIFSDDINWCKDNLLRSSPSPSKLIFSEGNTSDQDMCFMSMCHHNIIANSSFSWWGSYLNSNPNKIVVAPSKDQWYGKAYKDWNISDMYLPSWLLV